VRVSAPSSCTCELGKRSTAVRLELRLSLSWEPVSSVSSPVRKGAARRGLVLNNEPRKGEPRWQSEFRISAPRLQPSTKAQCAVRRTPGLSTARHRRRSTQGNLACLVCTRRHSLSLCAECDRARADKQSDRHRRRRRARTCRPK